MNKKYSPLENKIEELKDFADMFERQVLNRKKKFMAPQIGHQIGLLCSDLYQDYLLMKVNAADGTLSIPDYLDALAKYKMASLLVGIDHAKLGTTEILQELQSYTRIA